jgi:O-antigen ligase/polysaccharide polymerase Wzy-like membrane protein
MSHTVTELCEYAEERIGPAKSPVPFAALLTFTFVLLIAPQTIHPVLGVLRIALLAVGVAILANFWDRSARGAPLFELPRGSWPAIALGAWALVTAPMSYWPGGSIDLFLEMFSKSIIVFLLIPQIVDTRRRLRRLLVFLCVLGMVIAVTAVQNFLAGDFVATAGEVTKIEGYDAPLTANPNDMAMMLNLLLPLTWALFAIHRSGKARLALGALFALEAVAVFLTFSRAGFITLALVWTVHALRSLRGAWRFGALTAVAGGLCALAFLPGAYGQWLGTITDVSSDPTGSSQQRLQLMTTAVGVALDHPVFGAGLGMNVLAITAETGGWRHVHNVYLQYACDLGVLGFGLFVLLLWRCIKAARDVWQAREGRGERQELYYMARAIELSIWAFAIDAFFNPSGYNFYLFYVGGLAFAVQCIHQRESGT